MDIESRVYPNGTLLEILAPPDRARLMEAATPVTYTFGDVIVRQGESSDAMYVIVGGRARVVHENEAHQETVLNSVNAGDVFGEIGILRGESRNASVRASTDVSALKLPREKLKALIAECPHVGKWLENLARARVMFSFVKRASAFNQLPPPAIWDLISKLKAIDVAQGQVVCEEGDKPGPMFIVEQGRLRVSRKRGDNANEKKDVGYLRAGDFFGEQSLLMNQPRSATVEAASPSRLFALEPPAYKKLLERWPEFKQAIEERIANIKLQGEVRMPLDFASETLPALAFKPPAVSASKTPAVASEGSKTPPPKEPVKTKFKRRPRSFPFIQQVDEMDCGVACLAMICQYYGKKVTLSRLRDLAHTATDGTSLGNLCRAAAELGLAARAIKLSFSKLDEMETPALIHWENYHWVVLVQVKGKKVQIADPALGMLWYDRDEFLEKWNGWTGLFDYTLEFEKLPEQKLSAMWLWPCIKPYMGVMLQVLCLALVGSGLQMVQPVLSQVVVDRVMVEGATDVLTVILVAMAVTFVFLATSSLLEGYLLAFAATRIDAAALDLLTRRLLALPMSYFRTRRTGDIQRRLDGAFELREMLVHNGVAGMLATVEFVCAVTLMAVYNYYLMLIFLAVTPLYLGLMFLSSRYLKPLFDKLEDQHSKYHSEQLDSIKGIEAVKVSAAEGAFRQKLLDRFVRMTKQQFTTDFTMMTYGSLVEAVSFITSLLFLYAGTLMVIKGQLTLGGFVAFQSLVAMAHAPLHTMLSLWEDLQHAKVLVNRMGDIFETEPEQGHDRSQLLPVKTLSGEVELRGITFRYGGPESTPILKNINLKVPAGKTIAFVGRSGSGKTTLIKLLAGLLEPSEGAVLFDGIDQRSLNYRDLRRKLGFVLQETHIFTGSILDNITLGEDANLDRAVSAARVAAAHEFISRLPLGYETKIGESGISISGGQKQRVSIARAVYRNPVILIFDEATSALDTESERAVQDNLKTIFAGRTVFVVAHRLSTIRDADRIVVLEKGEIAEQGTHQELMDRNGLYFYLASRQVEQ